MFELVKVSPSTASDDDRPLLADSTHLAISKEVFLLQDPRPLYHYPEVANVPVTTHDNWEPQFKPVLTEQQVADAADRVAALAEAEAKRLAGENDDGSLAEGGESLEGDSLEDGDEDDMQSQQSSVVVKQEKSPKAASGRGKGAQKLSEAETTAAETVTGDIQNDPTATFAEGPVTEEQQEGVAVRQCC